MSLPFFNVRDCMSRLDNIIKSLYECKPYLGNLIFLDVETTGLEKDARIIEIGAIATQYDGFDIKISTFSELINPGFPIINKITEITGITNEELSHARGDEVYDDFINWWNNINPQILIAHNASFDKAKLEYNLFRINRQLTLPTIHCTMRMARQYLTTTSTDQLKTIAAHYNFVNNQAHRALTDTEVCCFVYAKMMLGEYD